MIEQGQEGAGQHAAHDRHAHRPPALRAGAETDRDRQDAGMVEKLVIRIGRSRISPAWSMASCADAPFARCWLANSTSRIEFLVTSPTSSTRPIWLNRLMFMAGIGGRMPIRLPMPTSQISPKPPTNASGSASMTVRGCTRLSNCEASTMYTTMMARAENPPELVLGFAEIAGIRPTRRTENRRAAPPRSSPRPVRRPCRASHPRACAVIVALRNRS